MHDRNDAASTWQSMIAAHDAGRIINPTLFRSQIQGSVHMGLGYALTEELPCPDGMPATFKLRELGVLRSRDMPEVEVILDDRDRSLRWLQLGMKAREVARQLVRLGLSDRALKQQAEAEGLIEQKAMRRPMTSPTSTSTGATIWWSRPARAPRTTRTSCTSTLMTGRTALGRMRHGRICTKGPLPMNLST